MRIYYRIVMLVVCALALALPAQCSNATPNTVPIALSPGQFTPFGVNPRNPNPTAGDFAGFGQADQGKLAQPAMVEFYSDY